MSNFPAGIDDSTTLPNPTSGQFTNNPDHAVLHSTENDAIKALETKLGIGASAATSGTLLRGTGSGTTAFAQANLTTDITGTLPVLNGGTGVTTSTGSGNNVLSTSPTLTTPVISSISNTGTLTLPTSTDTLVGRITTDTLTGKTMDGGSNTFTNINATSIITGAWQAWTPTFTNWTIGTGGSAGTTAAYVQIGKIVHFYIYSTLGTSGQSVGTGPQFSLPVTATAGNVGSITNGVPIGMCNALAAGSAYPGIVSLASTTKGQLQVQNAASTWLSSVAVTATQPGTWAAGDKFAATGTYEAA